MTAVLVPDLGDATDVSVIEIHVKPGDTVGVDDPIVTLESDKATMDVPSTVAGVVQSLGVVVGDVVAEGKLLVEVVEADTTSGEQALPAEAGPSEAPGAEAAVGVAPAATAGSVQVLVPDIGDATDVTVIEIHVKPGDAVGVDDPIVTLESDKATMDVPSSAAGVVSSVLVAVGDTVAEGVALIALAGAGAGAGDAPAPPAPPAPSPDVASSLDAGDVSDRERGSEVIQTGGIHASPLARRLARDMGVDLAAVTGTARSGRIGKDDVLAAAGAAEGPGAPAAEESAPAPAPVGRAAAPAETGVLAGLPPWPEVDFARFGEVETVPLSRIRKLVGANLHRNWVQIPHVTHHDDADVTDLEAFRIRTNDERAKDGVKLTMVALLLRASVAALREHPTFNASLSGGDLVLKRYYHLGVAVDTPNGLVVPVVRDVDRKGLLELASELAELSGRAREGKLTLDDMQGATFTISSLGGIGGTGFTPIVNAPEVAILGVARTAMKPVWDGSAFVPRLTLPLSLSYDHRVIDGAAAARFTRTLAAVLEDLRRLLL